MTTPHESFYGLLRLDAREPATVQAGKLGEMIAHTPPGHNQQFLLQAKAILGDPDKKAAYDARLRDQKPWSPQELHELAIAPAASAPTAVVAKPDLSAAPTTVHGPRPQNSGPNPQSSGPNPTVSDPQFSDPQFAGPPLTGRPPHGSGPNPQFAGPAPVPGAPQQGVNLAELGGKAKDTVKQVLPERKHRITAAAAAGIAVLLVLLISLFSCGGSSSSGSAVTPDDALTSSSLKTAQWSSKRSSSNKPRAQIHLNEAFALPSDISALLDESSGSSASILTQYQDKNVGVEVEQIGDSDSNTQSGTLLALYGQDGKLVSNTFYSSSDSTAKLPATFDLAKTPKSGYYRIVGADGLQIPAEANGTDPEMNYAASVLPDAFDDRVLWVVLRGGDQLYKADLRRSPEVEPAR